VPRPVFVRSLALAGLALAALAAAGPAMAEALRFRIQPEASEIMFRATSRLMNAEGHFSRFSGDVVVDPAVPTSAKIMLTIEAASLDTGIDMRDRHLRSVDFFDVERHPTIAFQSVRVESGGRRATVVASGEFIVNRGEYAMNYNSFLNPIGNEVRVAFTFRARVP
jgi:polyisoprenoid-binding protein YceI